MLAKLAALESDMSTKGTEQAHFYSSSGGNAGLGCVQGAVTLGCRATVVVPMTTTEHMISKLRAAGATDVIRNGASWQEADKYLTETVMPTARAHGEVAIYVHPFDAQEIWDGNAGMVHEIVRQMSDVHKHYPHTTQADDKIDAIVCSVGGGGLFCGIMQGLDELQMAHTKIITTETRGADSFYQAVKNRELVTLPAITSVATSLGARTVCKKALEYGLRDTVSTVVLSDAEAMDACRQFANDERLLVEAACGVCPALCYSGQLPGLIPGFNSNAVVVLIICGGSNMSFDIMEKYLALQTMES